MEHGRNAFEIKVGEHELILTLGNCACVLFRRSQEIDYLAVDVEDDQTIRVFNNPEIVRWIAGYQLKEKDGNWYRTLTRREVEPGVKVSFREFISQGGAEAWSPAIVEREEPSDREIEMFMEVNSEDFDSGLQELLGD